MKTYEFDVKLWANAEITAPSKELAVEVLQEILDSLDSDAADWPMGDLSAEGVKVVSFSLTPEASDIGDEEVT